MKKRSSLSRPAAGKLSLNKKTISNLGTAQMKNLVGGNVTHGANCNSKKNTCWCTGTCRVAVLHANEGCTGMG